MRREGTIRTLDPETGLGYILLAFGEGGVRLDCDRVGLRRNSLTVGDRVSFEQHGPHADDIRIISSER